MILNTFVRSYMICVVCNMVETLLTNITIITKLPSVELHVLPQVTFVGKRFIAFVARRLALNQVRKLFLGIFHVDINLIG